MTKPKVQGYDCLTGEHLEREMTDVEHAQWLKDTEATDETLTAD